MTIFALLRGVSYIDLRSSHIVLPCSLAAGPVLQEAASSFLAAVRIKVQSIEKRRENCAGGQVSVSPQPRKFASHLSDGSCPEDDALLGSRCFALFVVL